MSDLKASEPTGATEARPKSLPILDFIQRIDQMRIGLQDQITQLNSGL